MNLLSRAAAFPVRHESISIHRRAVNFHRTLVANLERPITPLFSGGTSEVQTSEHHKTWREVRASKLCHRCPVRLQHGVRHGLPVITILFSNSSTFLFIPRLCFWLFHALYSSSTFIRCRVAFLFVPRILLFMVFKWGEAFGLPRCSAKPAHFRFVFTS